MNGRVGVVVGVLTVGCAAAVSGIGIAVAGGGSSQIHACVTPADGSVRIVGSGKACHGQEKAIDWSRHGRRGPRGPAGPSKALSVQLYANVDQSADVGSNIGAVAASHTNANQATNDFYTVLFDRPVAHCSAQAQPGYAGGTLTAEPSAALVTPNSANPKALNVTFEGNDGDVNTAFMLTVTCKA